MSIIEKYTRREVTDEKNILKGNRKKLPNNIPKRKEKLTKGNEGTHSGRPKII